MMTVRTGCETKGRGVRRIVTPLRLHESRTPRRVQVAGGLVLETPVRGPRRRGLEDELPVPQERKTNNLAILQVPASSQTVESPAQLPDPRFDPEAPAVG